MSPPIQFSEEPKNKELVLSMMKGPAVLFALVFVVVFAAEGSDISSLDAGQSQLVASLSGGLEVGRTSSIFIDLRNNASSAPSKDLPLDLDSEELELLGITAELQSRDDEIEVLSGTQNAGSLGPGENRSLEFMVRAKEEAGIGIHPLELLLSYSTLSGAEVTGDADLPDIAFGYRTASQAIPLEVEAALGPRIEIEEVRGSAEPGEESTLEIAFVNKGDAPATMLEAQVVPQGPFSCRSCAVKINAINPGEKSSAKFRVVVDDVPEGEYALPLILRYAHAGRAEAKGAKEEEFAALVPVKGRSWIEPVRLPAALLLILLLALGVYLSKGRSRKKRSKRWR